MTETIHLTAADSEFDVEAVRADFPILATRVGDHSLVYLDNAATAQKPRVVIDSLLRYYNEQNANIHRGIHYLSELATAEYENARRRVGCFIHARDPCEIVFVRGTTEGIALVAHCYGRRFFGKGDEIIISAVEHHSNIVPWQLEAEERGASIKVIPMDDGGVLDLETYARLFNGHTKIVAISHISNALGTVNPIAEMTKIAHENSIPVLVDGAQAVPHMRIDVQALDCDFYVFSGHKVFGPTGIGVLYGKKKWLDEIPAYQGGGGTIRSVDFEKTIFLDAPAKFEGGTPNIAGAIALAVALDYIENLGFDRIAAYEKELLSYARETLQSMEGVRLFGKSPEMVGVISFLARDIHAHDISTFLNRDGIAVRAGHHCAQPLMKRLGVAGTARASFSFYNTMEEVERLAAAIRKVMKFFSR